VGPEFPTVVAAWRRAWTHVIPFFAFPPEVRRVIYTTNTVENLNREFRRRTKTQASFGTEDAALTVLSMASSPSVTFSYGRLMDTSSPRSSPRNQNVA
jgi:putative transposase